MFKSVLITLSTVAAITLSAGAEANAFGLASAARTIAPKTVTVQARQSDIACATPTDGCHRGHTFFLDYDARVRSLLFVQASPEEAVIDGLRRAIAMRDVTGARYASLSSLSVSRTASLLRIG
ncbi:MAG TPA: hypothetical protein VN112_16115 [Ensifer sp.]|nr:hypothetical protein [Ensifer sp.]